jgi:hypothetical protein
LKFICERERERERERELTSWKAGKRVVEIWEITLVKHPGKNVKMREKSY